MGPPTTCIPGPGWRLEASKRPTVGVLCVSSNVRAGYSDGKLENVGKMDGAPHKANCMQCIAAHIRHIPHTKRRNVLVPRRVLATRADQ